MTLKINYHLKNRGAWWIDLLFYFALSLLAAAVLCYFIFSAKVAIQKKDIKELDAALESVGTNQQKEFEKTVFDYQRKINDFTALLKNHQFVSTIFSFMERQTFFNIWFDKFTLNKRDGDVDMSGEADNMAALARQVSAFEKNEYIKKITVLSSKIGGSGMVDFNLNVLMDPKIFNPAFAVLEDSLVQASPSSNKILNYNAP